MSVVSTVSFNTPLGDPGDVLNVARDIKGMRGAPSRQILAATGNRGKIKRGKAGKGPKGIKAKKEIIDKPLNERQMRDIAEKSPTRVEIGPTIPIHPGTMPKPVTRGEGGAFAPNEAYGRWKERARTFNAGLEDQRIIQGHNAIVPGGTGLEPGSTRLTGFEGTNNLPELPKIRVPGKMERPRGFNLPRGNSATARRTRRGMINRMQGEAVKLNEARNRNINRRQNFPS
jgi:hypothetical protein